MNVLFWILQIFLTLLYLAGGAFKAFNPHDLAKQMTAIPLMGWHALGVFEILGAILLIVPAVTKWMPALTPLAAAALAFETLVLATVYAKYSLRLTVQNPLVWALVIGLTAAFVAYGRYAISPLA
jgi:hypothetical protein